MVNINYLSNQLKTGQISGNDLAKMVESNQITKSERRKITRMANAAKNEKELTERQKLRLAVKEKKALPKLTNEDRKRKFQKDLDSEREKESAKFTICLGCRKRGHFLKDCPKAALVEVNVKESVVICFNCGSGDHSLKNCTKKRSVDGSLPFATCFICKQMGHISKDCKQNANGLYVNGGCCHICLKKTHLVKDCPERSEEDKAAFLKHKQTKEEEHQLGVKVKGLLVTREGMHGDEMDFDHEVTQSGASGDEEDDDRPKNKKVKKDKRKRNK